MLCNRRILKTGWVASILRTVDAVCKQFEALHNQLTQAVADNTRKKRDRAQYYDKTWHNT